MLLQGLINRNLIDLNDEEGKIRREIKRIVVNELKIGEDIDSVVIKTAILFKKIIREGSPRWEVLYKNSSGKGR